MNDKEINESASLLAMMIKPQGIICDTKQPEPWSTSQPATSQNPSQPRTPLPNKK